MYSKAVTAPILLPQIANFVIFFIFLNLPRITIKSNDSNHPNDTYFPYEIPAPAKSKVNTAIF